MTAAPRLVPSLRAVTFPLEPGPPIDPIAVCGEDGVLIAGPELTLAGSGIALAIPLPDGLADGARLADAQALLAAIPCEDRVRRRGTGVVAHAALPFDPSEKGNLLVPSLTYGRDAAGHEWVTLVGEAPPDALARPEILDRLPSPPRAGEPPSVPEAVDLEPSAIPWSYRAAVAQAVDAIAKGPLRKVVLARRVQLVLPETLETAAVLRRLYRTEPLAIAFSFPVDGGRFVGASPELLVSRDGPAIRCHPLAGTVSLGEAGRPDPLATSRLLESAKDREEHQLVVDDIARVLGPRCAELSIPVEPSLVRLHTIAHLGTRIEGALRADAGSLPSVLELVAALHPTPAVGGVPRADALALIEEIEPAPRGHWAGPVGWTSATGDGSWCIGIRSATLAAHSAQAWAGAGIVARSDPSAELIETTLKLRPVLEAIAPGVGELLAR